MKSKTDLSGMWEFCLDGDKKGMEQEFYNRHFSDTIALPGTTSEAKKGGRREKREIGYLTEPYHFEGYAWYGREVEVKDYQPGDQVILKLERTRKSYVWIDGVFVGSRESFCTSHIYDLTAYLMQGRGHLSVMISNVDYKAPGGHMTSPDTQTNWNGILGEISLRVYRGVRLKDVFAESCWKKRQLKIAVNAAVDDKISQFYAKLAVSLCKKGESVNWFCESVPVQLTAGANEITHTFDLKGQNEPEGWNEYTPVLYEMRVEISGETSGGTYADEKKICIGFRDLTTDERSFYLNGQPLLLRGKHDGMIFPLTGYAPMDVQSWEKVFLTAKDYGINHYRFHTCCPPEAAFVAADEVGMYLEPELPFWGTIAAEGEPEYDKTRQEFLKQEGYDILREYGNHPSFLLFSLGNELWGNPKVLDEILGDYKAVDRRHWYVQGSNNFQFVPTVLVNDDFFCGVRFSKERLFRGSYAMCDAPQGHVQVKRPEMEYSYDDEIRPAQKAEMESGVGEIEIQFGTGTKKVKAEGKEELIPHIPVVSHEIGQYETYPDYREIEKYTGVLVPENLKIFKERLEQAGMVHMAQKFFQASGKLAVQCYKRELETAFKSRELAGFQILDLQDFTGQGTALVGILNAFMENKGLITADDWRSFCSDCVLMLSFPSFVYEEGMKFSYRILFSNMNPTELKDARIVVTMQNKVTGERMRNETERMHFTQTRLSEYADGTFRIPECGVPQVYEVHVEIEGSSIENSYEIYAFPKCHSKLGDVVNILRQKADTLPVITDRYEELKRAVAEGRKVLFFGTGIRDAYAMIGTYCTDFWCYPMFASISESMNRPKPVGTMGLYIRSEHPALAEFVTEEYETPQWWDIVTEEKNAILDGTDIEPIVWVIDNFARNHRLGLIYEAKVDNGSVLFCQPDLLHKDEIAAKWLFYSLYQYAASERFVPEQTMEPGQIEKMYG